jgi:hypothetical protein
MNAGFLVKGLFRSRRPKETGTQEAQNGRHPPDGPTTPPIATKPPTRDATSIAPKPSQPQSPSVTASFDGETSKTPSNYIAQAQVSPSSQPVAATHAKEPRLGTEFAAQQNQVISTSQRLWNDAYDGLENDGETAKLVQAYVNTLKTVLKAENAPDTPDSGANDVSTGLKDPTKRQIYMKKLLENGRAKVFTTSNITKGVGDVAQFILSAKGLVDLAVQNIPQAALPWAGVCIGLQVRTLHLQNSGFYLLIFV